MSSPAVSILIPLHSRIDLTRACLRSIHSTLALSYEVILVDDCSTDGTRDFLANLGPPHRLILNAEHSGLAHSINRAAELARADTLCFLNNDTVLQPGWLQPMLRGLAELPDAGIVGNIQWSPKIRAYDHMGIAFDSAGQPFHFGKHFVFRPYRGFTRWGAVTAACALIRRDLFLKADGFDTAYVNGCEDIDLCLRLETLGKKHYVANDSVIHHLVSSSPGRHLRTSQNERILLERWGDHTRRTWIEWDRDLCAINYPLRFLAKPWRYNGPKLARALTHLLLHPSRSINALRHPRR